LKLSGKVTDESENVDFRHFEEMAAIDSENFLYETPAIAHQPRIKFAIYKLSSKSIVKLLESKIFEFPKSPATSQVNQKN
jgi:hypothetical protein